MIDVRIGDSRDLIKELDDVSIDCVMTSPPYWGLRDYGHPDQIGLEKTPEEYLKKLLDLFDDVKLKLKDEGNCFVNLGDSYMGSGQDSGKQGREISQSICPNRKIGEASPTNPPSRFKHAILKPKCLCMIPQRFALGMIERGWILRNEIIWAKPNHMPESVTDRLTKAHEVIYHFVKQGKYYYNLDAIREPHTTESIDRYKRSVELGANAVQGKILQREEQNLSYPRHAPKWFIEGQNAESFGSPRARTRRTKFDDEGNKSASGLTDSRDYYRNNGLAEGHPNGKNPGDVWNVTTQPYPESHFAVFPLELVRRPILAGCQIGGIVLDPFAGSGTVGEFCRHNDRNAILFELNPEYKHLIDERAMTKISELETWCK